MKPRPLCRNCGTPISKTIIWVEFGRSSPGIRPDIPLTKADAQRLLNSTVVGVKMGTKDGQPFVRWARTWDGESYRNPYFCKDRCAMQFGYGVAAIKDRPLATEAYWTAIEKQREKA